MSKNKTKTVLGLNILEFNVHGISCYCFLRQDLSLAFRLIAFQTWYAAQVDFRIHSLELASVLGCRHTHQYIHLSGEVFSIGQSGSSVVCSLILRMSLIHGNGFIITVTFYIMVYSWRKGSAHHTHSPDQSVLKIADLIPVCSGRNSCWNWGWC